MRKDTRLLTTLSSSAILICIFACSPPDSPNIESTIGDASMPIEDWEPAPISMATGTRYALRAIEGYEIKNAVPGDERVLVYFQSAGETEKLVLAAPDEELDTDVELDIKGNDTQGFTNVELSIRQPDQFQFALGEDPDNPVEGPILFMEDNFALPYELLAEGEVLAGYDFMPYAEQEGVTVASSTMARQANILSTTLQRVLELEVAPESSSLTLSSEKAWLNDASLERVEAARVDNIRWIDAAPYSDEEDASDDLPCCEIIDRESTFTVEDDTFAPISLRALSGTSPVFGVTFIVGSKTPEVCSVFPGGTNESTELDEDNRVLVKGGLFEQFMVVDQREGSITEGDCILEAALQADPSITSSINVQFVAPED